MADIISRSNKPTASETSARESVEPAYALIELLYFGYRDFVGDPDSILATYGFGRAHHRVLYFVRRNPGLTVAELLDILKITKQSLGRVLRDVTEQDFVMSQPGELDRRQRRLFLTAKGTDLVQRLALLQTQRIRSALGDLGADAEDIVMNFLLGMVDDAEREAIRQRVMPDEQARG